MSDSPHTPADNGIFLDHLAHWIPDLDAAASALEGLGFRLTPYTEHDHAPAPGAEVEPAGTANRCIMLREGYLEILTATRDTALAAEVRRAMARYIGVHLTALCVADPLAEHARLMAQGFPQRPPVALKRPATLADGREALLAFTVIRPQPGLLPEGRVQFLSHETPEWLWEERWLDQPNGAEALTDVLFLVEDLDESAGRYARYLRTDAAPIGDGARRLEFERGSLTLMTGEAARAALPGLDLAPAPCMAAHALRSADLEATRRFLTEAGFAPREGGDGALCLALPASLGGVLCFHDGSGPPWATA